MFALLFVDDNNNNNKGQLIWQISTPSGTSIRSSVSAQIIIVTDRHSDTQTDTQTTLRITLITIARIYALRASMRPNYIRIYETH